MYEVSEQKKKEIEREAISFFFKFCTPAFRENLYSKFWTEYFKNRSEPKTPILIETQQPIISDRTTGFKIKQIQQFQ